jgi:hypothetical protein
MHPACCVLLHWLQAYLMKRMPYCLVHLTLENEVLYNPPMKETHA